MSKLHKFFPIVLSLLYILLYIITPDVNECAEDTDGCDEHHETCVNSGGSFSCRLTCAEGYSRNAQNTDCHGIIRFVQLRKLACHIFKRRYVPVIPFTFTSNLNLHLNAYVSTCTYICYC